MLARRLPSSLSRAASVRHVSCSQLPRKTLLRPSSTSLVRPLRLLASTASLGASYRIPAGAARQSSEEEGRQRERRPPRSRAQRAPSRSTAESQASFRGSIVELLGSRRPFATFNPLLAEARRRDLLVPFHEALVEELRTAGGLSLDQRTLLYSFAGRVRKVAAGERDEEAMADQLRLLTEDAKATVLAVLASDEWRKPTKSAKLIETLSALSATPRLIRDTADELREDQAFRGRLSQALSEELGGREASLNRQAVFRLVRLARLLRLQGSEEDCSALCGRLRRWLDQVSASGLEDGQMLGLRLKDAVAMHGWLRESCLDLWRAQPALATDVFRWVLDPDNEQARRTPGLVAEILAAFAADNYAGFLQGLDASGRRDHFAAFLEQLFADRRSLQQLSSRGQFFVYKLHCLIQLLGPSSLPSMPAQLLASLAFLESYEAFFGLSAERCPHGLLLDSPELAAASAALRDGCALVQLRLLPHSMRALVVETPEGSPVAGLRSVREQLSPAEAQGERRRLFFPLHREEVDAQGRPTAEAAQMMAFLGERLNYDVRHFVLEQEGGRESDRPSSCDQEARRRK